jgi:dTDP-4-dehydrorhamnose reductase
MEVHSKIVAKIKPTSTRFIYCSTTNVFDGEVSRHHAENDTPIAESEYGQFKIKCENLINNELGARGIIVRLPMVWGKNSPRLNDINEKIKNGQEIEAYQNIYLNHALDHGIANQIRLIIENNLTGIFHLATTDIESQYTFISKLVQNYSTDVNVKAMTLENVVQYNFGLIINRSDLPANFNYQNEELIRRLIK